MKDAGVGDDKDEDNEDDDDGKRGAAADNQNLNPHLFALFFVALFALLSTRQILHARS